MLINKQFAAELYRTANPYKAFAAVNPYADAEDVRRAANNLIDNENTEADIIELLVQETQQIEAQMAADDDDTLLTLAEQRAILARIARGKQKIKRHVRIRNIVVPVYEDPSATQMILAVRLDRQLAKDQQKLHAAIAAELLPQVVAKQTRQPRQAQSPIPAEPAPPAQPQQRAQATPPAPQAPAIPSTACTPPISEKESPTQTPAPETKTEATPTSIFTNPDPGYEPVFQKIARWKQEEQNLTIEQRLERDYQEGEAQKEKNRRQRREKKMR